MVNIKEEWEKHKENKEEKKPKTQVQKWREEKEKENVVTKKDTDICSNNNNDDVTTVTTVTTVTPVTTQGVVTPVTCDTRFFSVIFGESTFEKMLHFLADKNRAFTYDEIAKSIGKSVGSVRQTISRKMPYFVTNSEKGVKCNTFLSQLAKNEICNRCDELLALEEENKQKQDNLKLKRLEQEEINVELISFFSNYKPKREGEFILIDFGQVIEFSSKLGDFLLDEPEKFIEQVKDKYGLNFSIKFINIPFIHNVSIEDIRKDYYDRLVVIEGRVTSLSSVNPLTIESQYECPSCGSIITVKQDYKEGVEKEPQRCSCGRKGKFFCINKKEVDSCYLQLEDLQEKTDNPHSQRIKGILMQSLCNSEMIKMFTPGNEVECVGILKKVNKYKGSQKLLITDKILEIVNVKLIEKEVDIKNFEDNDIYNINLLSKKIDEKGIDVLYNSFAPDVFGYEEIKGAMILQACNKRNNLRERTVRNKSNILMIGDPGIAKSVLGDFALKISSGSRKAVGGGSSAVGITASVVKEEDSLGGYRVEPGAMVLAKDLLFIDELNNLNEDDKPKLQEGMNEQRISINKANLHVQMKVTCGIIASANPVHGHFKDGDKLTIQEQFNIPTPILNRFDSIFVMRDDINEYKDKQIAEKMINRQRGILKPDYDCEFLKKFFVYIKQLDEPEINDNTQKILSNIYFLARNTYNPGVKINPRFLESLTRMSISAAKLRQGKEVELKDIQQSIKILSKTQYNINPEIACKVGVIK